MCYTLPKIWMGRIQKYWDKIMPTDFPQSSSEFKNDFEDPEVKSAVDKFEEELGTEESVVLSIIPEGTVVTNYVGTYDVEGTPGELTLLSPEKVTTDNIAAIHYNTEIGEWVKVEDAHIIDGYVWGTLESFSPIAIVEYKKDIHFIDAIPGEKSTIPAVICEGNSVKVYVNENGKTVALNTASGTEIELTKKTYIVGGSSDGTPIEKTHLTVVGIPNNKIVGKIIGGSVFIPDDIGTETEEPKITTVGEINVYVEGCSFGGITGSIGSVRTDVNNTTVKDSTIAWYGVGQGYAKLNTEDTSLACRSWVKKANLNFINTHSALTFCGQNNEYFYVEDSYMVIEGGNHEYLVSGGSNSRTNTSEIAAKNAIIGVYQSTNRGNVAATKVTFNNCKVDKLYIGGDIEDKTVTGTTSSIKYIINAGSDDSYNILRGFENGVLMTDEDMVNIVDSIKVSRSANVTLEAGLDKVLGSKYVIK